MIEARADFETRSAVNIKTSGQGAYFACPHFMPLLLRYRIGNGHINGWRYTNRHCPADLLAHIESGGLIRAFNASFERQCFDWLADNWGWPRPSIEQYVCTAAEAAAMSLPRALGNCGAALGLGEQKDKEGSDLIKFFCVPRRKSKNVPWPSFHDPKDHAEAFDRFDAYCEQDIVAEEAVANRVMQLSTYEQRLYTIDQNINARGLRIDMASARAGIRFAAKAKLALNNEMRALTDGAVSSCSQIALLVAWIEKRMPDVTSMAKADIEDLLEREDLPDDVRKALLLRQEAGKTTVAKLTAFSLRVSPDDRIRNSFLFNAAGTGRWSSTGAQVHNLARPRKEFGDAHPNPEVLYETIRMEDPEIAALFYGPVLGLPLHLLSDAIRGFIWAGPGKDLLASDYTGIEGAVAAWFAGERWKLDAMFELIDDDSLPDLYRRAAAGIFATTTDLLVKKDPRRQVGKVSELSLQYQGGVGAFRSMARNYSIKMDSIFQPVWDAADAERRERATKRYKSCCTRNETTTQTMTEKAWIAGELVKIGWRHTNPAICDSWPLLEAAVREAVEYPGRVVKVLKVEYLVRNGFLWCKLPSGRCLAYGSPRLKPQVWAKLKISLFSDEYSDAEVMDKELAERWAERGLAAIQGPTSSKVSVLGVDSATKRWIRYGLYGGILFENIVQAIARDLLANGIVIAEEMGYPVVGHVHDEIVTEVPRGWGDLAEFSRRICTLPDWAEGIPLTASGWRGKRYRKD